MLYLTEMPVSLMYLQIKHMNKGAYGMNQIQNTAKSIMQMKTQADIELELRRFALSLLIE